MAVNAIHVLYLTAGLFKAVPSKTVLTDLAKATNIETLAKDLGNTPYAINAFPVTSNAEKAKVLAENLLGSSVADKTAAVTALEGVLNANGGNVGVAALIAINEILKGGTYADAKAQLENRVKVAEAYVNSPRGTEISNSILNEVTKDAATATAAIEKLNSNNTPAGNYAGTPNDDTVSLLGGLASTIKIEGGQQGAAGDTLVITAQASATANVINLQNFADQNRTLDTEQRKVSPIIQGFENVDATGSTTEMNITGRDRTSELNTGSVASTQTGSVLKGGAYRDTVTGAAGADSIEGNAGNDVLDGGAGNDTIKGGADNDNITGGTGNDTIEDGTGNDTVSGGADNDTITIGGGVDLINGDDGNDTISFAKDAAAGTSATVRTTVNGGAGSDSIDNTNATAASFLQVSGGANNDKITLGVATENINAGADNDIIVITQKSATENTLSATDVLNGNDGQDALQLLIAQGAGTTTFVLNPVNGQFSGFEVIELIDQSGDTNAKTYKINLTDNFVANNMATAGATGRFLIDARGLPAGSNLVIDTSALTAASAAAFTAGNFHIWTSPSTDIRDQLNKTIDANYAINASNAALNATRAFYTNASDTTNKAGVHDATTGLITTTPAGATAYTVTGGTAEVSTGGSSTGNTFTLTAGTDIITSTSTNLAAQPGVFFGPGNDTVTGGAGLVAAGDILVDGSTVDEDVFNAQLVGGAALAPTNWSNIETINFELLGDHIIVGAANNAVTLTGAINYKTLGVTGANRQIDLVDVRNGTTVNVGNGVARVEIDKLGTTVTDTLTINLAGGTVGTTTAGQELDLDSAGQDFSVVTLNSTGAANTVYADFAAGQFSTNAGDRLTITGTQNLTLVASSADLTGQRITNTNTGTTTINTRDAGAANVNAANFVGITNYLTTNTAAANTVNLTGLLTNSNVTVGSDSTVVTLAAQTAGSTVNVTANGDMTQLVGAAGHNITTANLTLTTGTDNGAAAENASALTINLDTSGGVSSTVNLLGTTAAERGLTVTVTSGNVNASNFTVNGTDATAGVISTTGITLTAAAGANAAGYSLTGTAKNDTVTGSAQADVLVGGTGDDVITGNAGADALTGGAGADSFVYAAVANSAASVAANTTVTFDTISDFATTSDKINLAAINTALTGAGAATGITVTTLTTGAASLNDTTLATFAELKVAVDALTLTASAAGVAGAATGLQAYVIDLTGNTGALGTGKYLVINNNDTALTAADVMIQLIGTSTSPVAGDFTLA